jgi:hypothetical protein
VNFQVVFKKYQAELMLAGDCVASSRGSLSSLFSVLHDQFVLSSMAFVGISGIDLHHG